jgi:hypothetical protein
MTKAYLQYQQQEQEQDRTSTPPMLLWLISVLHSLGEREEEERARPRREFGRWTLLDWAIKRSGRDGRDGKEKEWGP